MSVADYRFAGPVRRCLCGSFTFKISGGFDDEMALAWWGLDAECGNCGALVRVPCPADRPEPPYFVSGE